ncbi:surface-adhesin E family protein [Phenylobacterium sp.]|uniref:surface-adhesin E family protein n=1 Tax=Phenylobacterium sp. TaxID=1871053 RepID=UPI002732248B|nr:surface-adhesin E family protein [Phenylobacterium sp.]MDP1875187.1 hypothetical protein [Phenylobacterium sp.]
MKIAALLLPATMVAAAISGSANAQSSYLWEELGSGDGLTACFNPLSVKHENGMVTFLEKISYAMPTAISGGRSMSYYTVKMTIDCAASTYQHADFIAYSADGAALTGVQDPTPSGMHPISPGGVPAAFQGKFCK